MIILHLAGMGTFDAINYALATVSTGGYSTHSNSVAAFDSWAVELSITRWGWCWPAPTSPSTIRLPGAD